MVYNFPANGSFVTSIDYRFQNHVTSGSFFGLQYQPGTFIYRLDETNSIFAPKFALDTPVLVHTHSPPSSATIIGIRTYTSSDVYTMVFKDGSISEYTSDLLSAAPSPVTHLSPNLLPPWIVLLLRYFWIICPSHVMVNLRLMSINFGNSFLVNLLLGFCYPTFRQIVNIFLIPANYSEVTQNSRMSMTPDPNLDSRIVFLDMSQPMVFTHSLHLHH